MKTRAFSVCLGVAMAVLARRQGTKVTRKAVGTVARISRLERRLGATTQTIDPNQGVVKKMYWKMFPKLKLDGKTQPWSVLNADDVAFTQQIDMAINYGVSSLKNR